MSGLLIVVALVAGAGVLLLASRVSVSVRIERTDRARAAWRFIWLGGLIRMRGSVPGGRAAAVEPPPPARAKRRRARRRPFRGVSIARSVLLARGFVPRVARLGADVVRRVAVEDLQLRVEYGFDDPADTGRVCGVVAPLAVAASSLGWNVQAQPRFLQPGLEGAFAATLHVRPIAVVAAVAGFLFSLPFLRALLAAWRSR